MKRLQKFNLIEVIISFIVIIFSLFILVSFTTLSLQNSTESFNAGQVSNCSDNLTAFIKRLPVEATGSMSLSDFPTTKPMTDTRRSQYPSLSAATLDSSNEIAFQTHILENTTTPGAYLVSTYDEINSIKTKRIEYEVRIWHSEVSADSNFSTNTSWVSNPASFKDTSLKSSASISNLNYSTLTKLNIEFSWPINRAYDDRSKKYFFINLSRLLR